MATQQEITGLKEDANKLFEEKDYLGAIRILLNLISFERENAEYFFQLAVCYKKLAQQGENINDSNFLSALGYYTFAIDYAKNDIDKAKYYAGRAELYSLSQIADEKEKALNDLNIAIQLDPSNHYYQQQVNRFKSFSLDTKDDISRLYQKIKLAEGRSNWAAIKALAWAVVTVAAGFMAFFSFIAIITSFQFSPLFILSLGFFAPLTIIAANETISNYTEYKDSNEAIGNYETSLCDIAADSTTNASPSATITPINQPVVKQQQSLHPYPATATNSNTANIYPNIIYPTYPGTLFAQNRVSSPSSTIDAASTTPSAPTFGYHNNTYSGYRK